MKSDLKVGLVTFWSVLIVGWLGVISYDNFQYLSSIPLSDTSFTRSIVLKREFNLDNFKDAAGVDVIHYNNHYYPAYPPGYSFLAVIPYGALQVFNWVWVKFLPPINGVISMLLESLALTLPAVLSLALISFLLFRLLRFYNFSQPLSGFVAWALAFTTFLTGYLPSAFFHLPAALFLFAGFYLLVTKEKFTWSTSLLIGLLLGMVVITEYVTALCFIPVGLVFFYRSRSLPRSIVCLLGFTIGLCILGAYNYALFGSPWHFSESLAGTASNPAEVTSYGVAFTGSPVTALYGNYLSPVKGLVANAPLTLFLPFGLIIFAWKKKLVAGLSLSFILIISGVYSFWHDWGGGWSLGPRFYISLMPFFFLAAAFALEYVTRHWLGKLAVTFLTAAGLVVSFTSLLMGPRVIIPKATGYLGLVALQRLSRLPIIISEGAKNPLNVASFIIQKYQELPIIPSMPFLVVFTVFCGLVLTVMLGSLYLILVPPRLISNYDH